MAFSPMAARLPLGGKLMRSIPLTQDQRTIKRAPPGVRFIHLRAGAWPPELAGEGPLRTVRPSFV